MWRLAVPDFENARENLITALTFVDGTVVHLLSEADHSAILDLYAAYDDHLGQPATHLEGAHLSEVLRQVLHNAYSQVQVGGRLADYRNKLKLLAELCPYCGYGSITDLDHHLPRSKYKAHAVYAKNLIPSCHPCNNLKRAKAGEFACAQFSHVYLGVYPVEQFLFASVTILKKGIRVVYSVEHVASISADEYERLKFQFETLQLNHRYGPQVNIFLGGLRTSVEECGALGAQILKAYLAKAHSSHCESFGANHWQSVLLMALSESVEFCSGGYRTSFGQHRVVV